MVNADPEENPLYRTSRDLHGLHWEALRRRPREEVCAAAGAEADGDAYVLGLLGRSLRVDPQARCVTWAAGSGADAGYQRALVAVTYLAGALEIPPRGEWVAFRELPGGDAFFRGPHSLATPRLERAFGGAPARLVEAAAALGGTPAEAGDAAADLPALPRISVRAVLWAESEEFPAAASLLTDARAGLHLPLDVLWALANVAVSDLVEAGR